MVMKAASERSTASVRRLHKGETFVDDDGTFEVTEKPEVVEGKEVHLNLRRVPDGVRSTRYIYPMDARVNIAR